jgi:hypothetical protein
MRTHHLAARHTPPMHTHRPAPWQSSRWSHPRLSARYNLEWDPLRSDPPQWESGWASFIRGLGDRKTWVTDQFSIGIFVLIAMTVVLTLAVLLHDALVHAVEVWLGR